MIRHRYIYKDGVQVGHQDWHEAHPDDAPAVRQMHAAYPPVRQVALQPLGPGEVEFDHEPTSEEIRGAS